MAAYKDHESLTESTDEISHSGMSPARSDILKPLHRKLDAILALLERWEATKSIENSQQLHMDLPFSSPPSTELTPGIRPSPVAEESSRNATLEVVEDPKRSKHKKLSAQNLLASARRRSKQKAIASVDMATWTEQVRERLRFDAAASIPVQGVLAPQRRCSIDRSQVPSIEQMNGAFVQAVTLAKGERHAFFNQEEECYDVDFEKLGQRTSEDDDDVKLPGMVTSRVSGIVPDQQGSGSETGKKKVTTLTNLSVKSQAHILDKYNDSAPPENVNLERDSGSMLLLSRIIWMFLITGPVAVLHVSGQIYLHTFLAEGDFRFGTLGSELICGLAAVITVALLRRALQSDDLNLAVDKLQLFVSDFMVQWSEVSGREWRVYLMAWLLMVCCFTLSNAMDMSRSLPRNFDSLQIVQLTMNGVGIFIFSVASFLVSLAAYVQSHFLLGLDRSLDCWCCSILNDSDFALGVESWNCLQALLKCIGRGIASSFLALQAFGAIGMVYVLASAVTLAIKDGFQPEVFFVEMVIALPLLVFFFMNMRVCAHGAALTEKCRVIPAFVNQIPTQEALDEDRQYLVRYVSDSSAGFFVKDAKLTREMFLKNFVTIGGLLTGAAGVLSRVVLV
ncbi:unnamed protein product [Durusdinium trenchii]|uniref:Uncharacterized protein n=2 Tax=Durusdinium trenchii TaxID=1381693 RepID=A0ABP0RTM0_9DINO